MKDQKKNTGKAPSVHHTSKWVRYHYDDAPGILNVPGVYAIYLDDELVYIGQSALVKKRVFSHGIHYGYGLRMFTPWQRCKDCYFKVRYTTKYGDWAMRELRLIRRLHPKYNQIGTRKVG